MASFPILKPAYYWNWHKLLLRNKLESPLTPLHLPKSSHREIPLCTLKTTAKGRGGKAAPSPLRGEGRDEGAVPLPHYLYAFSLIKARNDIKLRHFGKSPVPLKSRKLKWRLFQF